MTPQIVKEPLHALGLAQGSDKDVGFRNFEPKEGYRQLTADEIQQLLLNNNTSNAWDAIWVTDSFLPSLVQNSKFYGHIMIGDMEAVVLHFKDLRLPCGIYDSTIINCEIGNCVAIHQVRYMSCFSISDAVMLSNIDEMQTSFHAKFGNGVLYANEPIDRRIKLEICNENGGRWVLPFDGMKAADAWLWSRCRNDEALQKQFLRMAEQPLLHLKGEYSSVGTGSVIKNSHTIKDVKIGEYAYIKGVNKLKNLTIHSSQKDYTQIGEGCELVNGIIASGCRIFYGVKAVRFVLAAHSQLKYGARLINSFLGENSTISCCEVLNSLIFSAHEQHHNNSFLCAVTVLGQSNMAAGATIGSNHNSRAADGEIFAGRGFWPGLCVSLKHNSRFASYTLIVKGDFLHELDIRLPFSLVSNEASGNRLIIVPAYWFLYNMYALIRNQYKFKKRDKRAQNIPIYEYDILAPDTVNEMLCALEELETAVAKVYFPDKDTSELAVFGKQLLQGSQPLTKDILLKNTENSKREVLVVKPQQAYLTYQRMIRYYGALAIKSALENQDISSFLAKICTEKEPYEHFENIGGQLVPVAKVSTLRQDIAEGKWQNWHDVHRIYNEWSDQYESDKSKHALAALAFVCHRSFATWTAVFLKQMLIEALDTRKWIVDAIQEVRKKDYESPFKKMLYETEEEMTAVIGAFDENDFILSEKAHLVTFEKEIHQILSRF